MCVQCPVLTTQFFDRVQWDLTVEIAFFKPVVMVFFDFAPHTGLDFDQDLVVVGQFFLSLIDRMCITHVMVLFDQTFKTTGDNILGMDDDRYDSERERMLAYLRMRQHELKNMYKDTIEGTPKEKRELGLQKLRGRIKENKKMLSKFSQKKVDDHMEFMQSEFDMDEHGHELDDESPEPRESVDESFERSVDSFDSTIE